MAADGEFKDPFEVPVPGRAPSPNGKPGKLNAMFGNFKSALGSIRRKTSLSRHLKRTSERLDGIKEETAEDIEQPVYITGASASSWDGMAFQWTAQKCTDFVRGLGILTLPADGAIEQFLLDAIAEATPPRPWITINGQDNKLYFQNEVSDEVTTTHPLEHIMPKLAIACRDCFNLESVERYARVRSLHDSWFAEAEVAQEKWVCKMSTSKNRPYHYHIDTEETTWEDPSDIVLPEFQVRLAAISRLVDDKYVDRLKDYGRRVLDETSERDLANLFRDMDHDRFATIETSQPRKAYAEWTEAEVAAYVSRLECGRDPAVAIFLQDVLMGSTLPPPWISIRNTRNEVMFENPLTQVVVHQHPLHSVLPALADACKDCLSLETEYEESYDRIKGLHEQWTAEASMANKNWRYVEDQAGGRPYYVHVETGESRWDNPNDGILAAAHIKLEALGKLVDEGYMTQLIAAAESAEKASRSEGEKRPDNAAVPSLDLNDSFADKGNARWTDEELRQYILSLKVLSLPADVPILKFLKDAINADIENHPWVARRDGNGKLWFHNAVTRAKSQKHPYENSLRQLAILCKQYLGLSAGLRLKRIRMQRDKWNGEAKADANAWVRKMSRSKNKEYFEHRETSESLWHNPAAQIRTMNNFRVTVLDWLLKDDYCDSLGGNKRSGAMRDTEANNTDDSNTDDNTEEEVSGLRIERPQRRSQRDRREISQKMERKRLEEEQQALEEMRRQEQMRLLEQQRIAERTAKLLAEQRAAEDRAALERAEKRLAEQKVLEEMQREEQMRLLEQQCIAEQTVKLGLEQREERATEEQIARELSEKRLAEQEGIEDLRQRFLRKLGTADDAIRKLQAQQILKDQEKIWEIEKDEVTIKKLQHDPMKDGIKENHPRHLLGEAQNSPSQCDSQVLTALPLSPSAHEIQSAFESERTISPTQQNFNHDLVEVDRAFAGEQDKISLVAHLQLKENIIESLEAMNACLRSEASMQDMSRSTWEMDMAAQRQAKYHKLELEVEAKKQQRIEEEAKVEHARLEVEAEEAGKKAEEAALEKMRWKTWEVDMAAQQEEEITSLRMDNERLQLQWKAERSLLREEFREMRQEERSLWREEFREMQQESFERTSRFEQRVELALDKQESIVQSMASSARQGWAMQDQLKSILVPVSSQIKDHEQRFVRNGDDVTYARAAAERMRCYSQAEQAFLQKLVSDVDRSQHNLQTALASQSIRDAEGWKSQVADHLLEPRFGCTVQIRHYWLEESALLYKGRGKVPSPATCTCYPKPISSICSKGNYTRSTKVNS